MQAPVGQPRDVSMLQKLRAKVREAMARPESVWRGTADGAQALAIATNAVRAATGLLGDLTEPGSGPNQQMAGAQGSGRPGQARPGQQGAGAEAEASSESVGGHARHKAGRQADIGTDFEEEGPPPQQEQQQQQQQQQQQRALPELLLPQQQHPWGMPDLLQQQQQQQRALPELLLPQQQHPWGMPDLLQQQQQQQQLALPDL